MNDPQFFQTRMGQQFYERTVPELVTQLGRLNELLARLVAVQERDQQEKGDGNP